MNLHIRILGLSKPLVALNFLILTHVVFLASPAPASPVTPAQAQGAAPFRGELTFEKLEQNLVHFGATAGTPVPPPVKLEVHGAKGLGTLYTRPEMEPYVLISALPCAGCEERRSLYLVSPRLEFKPTAFVSPGRVKDRSRGIIFFEGRGFFGQCLPGRNDVYISFQRERSEKRARLYTSVYIAEVKADGIREQLLARHAPNINQVLQKVRAKQCTEVAGFDRHTGSFSVPPLKGGELQEDES